MESIFVSRGYRLSNTCLYQDQPLPAVRDIDALVVMGGPMGVYEQARYPWLRQEKKFIESVLKQELPVLGVCLGAQLLAEVLGATVMKNSHEEIGWFPVRRIPALQDKRLQGLPAGFDALHWHGDTFSIPSGACNFIVSDGCTNQAFVYGNNVLGLQFHLEMLPSHVQAIYEACGRPDQTGAYIQNLDEMLAPADSFCHAHTILRKLLGTFIL